MKLTLHIAAWVAGILLLTSPWVAGCSIPVFQYALENWHADAYVVEIVHRDELAADLLTEVERLGRPAAGQAAANVQVQARRQADAPPEGRITVHFPPQPGRKGPLWTAPLRRENLEAIVASPLRETIAGKLIAGDTAVWVLITCTDADENARALARLEAALADIKGVLQYPQGYVEEVDRQVPGASSTAPPGFSFPIVTLDRDAAAEAFLVQNLLQSEADLADLDMPMAFPIFGRGRALYALVGKGINRDTIAEACAFMTGACSCQVKALNPGVDLLLTAAWEKVFEILVYPDDPPPVLASVMPVADTGDVVSEAPSPAPPRAGASVSGADPSSVGRTETDRGDGSDEGAAGASSGLWSIRSFFALLLLAAALLGGISVVVLRRSGAS